MTQSPTDWLGSIHLGIGAYGNVFNPILDVTGDDSSVEVDVCRTVSASEFDVGEALIVGENVVVTGYNSGRGRFGSDASGFCPIGT